jgi:hypothetical protein
MRKEGMAGKAYHCITLGEVTRAVTMVLNHDHKLAEEQVPMVTVLDAQLYCPLVGRSSTMSSETGA